jgi:hypothetical protein
MGRIAKGYSHDGNIMTRRLLDVDGNNSRVEPFSAFQRLIPDPGYPIRGSIGGYGGHVRDSRSAHRSFAMQQHGGLAKLVIGRAFA